MIFTPTSDCRAESICENPYGIIKDYWRVLGAYNNQQVQEYKQKMCCEHKAKNPYVKL